jgi:hypothetical protein
MKLNKTLAIVLAALFGPLGLLYSSLIGAAVTFSIVLMFSFIIFSFAIKSYLPVYLISILITIPISIMWANNVVDEKNKINNKITFK